MAIEERCAFLQLLEIEATFESAASTVWLPGFRPDRAPMIFVRSARTDERAPHQTQLIATAVNLPEVAELTPAIPLELPIGLHAPLHRFDPAGVLPVEEFLVGDASTDPVRLGLTVAGQDCAVFAIDQSGVDVRTHEFARFLVHELFHFHQLFEANWRVPFGYDPNVPYQPDPTDMAMAMEEGSVIERAASALDIADALADTIRFLRLRERRHERRPDLAWLEPGNEQIEGSARFVENQYASCNGRERRLPTPAVDPTSADHQQFGRHYRTGARACEVLEQLGVTWRDRLSDGADPVGILAQTLADLRVDDRSAGSLAAV